MDLHDLRAINNAMDMALHSALWPIAHRHRLLCACRCNTSSVLVQVIQADAVP